MAEIYGNNITYTGSMIFNSKANTTIIRIPTDNSTDNFDTASEILNFSYGINDYNIGETFLTRIKNESDFVIYIYSNTGITMENDSIAPRTTTSYMFIKTSSTTLKCIKTSTGTERDSTGTFLKDINVYGTIFDYKSVANLTAVQGITYTAGQLFGGYIKRTIASNYTDLLPTASSIISSIKYPKIGTSFHCYIQVITNLASSPLLTINGNTGMSISGSDNIISKDTTVLLLFTVTGETSVMCYIMGILTSSVKGNAALITNITTETYTALNTDSTLNVDTNIIRSLCTITLPSISIVGQKRYFITDSTGKAGLYNIRVIPKGSDTIIGTSSVTINSNYSSISMYNDGVGNWLLY